MVHKLLIPSPLTASIYHNDISLSTTITYRFLRLFMVRIFPRAVIQEKKKKATLKRTLVYQILFQEKRNTSFQPREL
jgi:hypothetical protein